eukprot:Nk52_evm30s255 gene=Nk52_evmTU30s255
MPKSKRHYFSKRFAQLGQRFAESTGERSKTELSEEYVRLEHVSKSMKDNYEKLHKRTEKFMEDENGCVDLEKTTYSRMVLINRDKLGKVANTMISSGEALGENTSLGSAYLMCGDAERAVTSAYLDFESEALTKFLRPLQGPMREQLKAIDSAIKKVQSDRLYLDAKKYKAATARKEFKNYDSSRIKHKDKKVNELAMKLEGEVEGSLEQMFGFFHEAEDKQLQILCDFIAAQREFYRQGFETLAELGEDLELLKCQPLRSIAGHTREMAHPARAMYDFDATKPDEMSMRAGEVVTVLGPSKDQEGWMEACNAENTQSGLVPSNFIEALTPEEELDFKRAMGYVPTIDMPFGGQDMQKGDEQQGGEFGTEDMVGGQQFPLDGNGQMPMHAEMMDGDPNLMGGMQEVRPIEIVGPACDDAMSAIRNILQDMTVFGLQAQYSNFPVHPEDFDVRNDALLNNAQGLVGILKEVLNGTTGVPEQLADAVLMSVEKFANLSQDAKNSVHTITESNDRQNLMLAAQNVLQSFLALIDTAKFACEDPQLQPEVKKCSKNVKGAIMNMLDCVQDIKNHRNNNNNNNGAGGNTQTELELLAAGEDIVRAEQSLNALKKRNVAQHDEDYIRIQTEDCLIDDCRDIARAGTRLIQAARQCQKAIEMSGQSTQTSANAYNTNSAFAGGLVGAAKEVAACIGALCEMASGVVRGERKIESAIAAAQMVSAATSQVVLASKNKNPDMVSQRKLEDAGKEIDDATGKLVERVNQYHSEVNSKSAADQQRTYAQERAAELDARAKIAEMERELAKARGELQGVNTSTYKQGDASGAAGGSDVPPELPTPPSFKPAKRAKPKQPPPPAPKSGGNTDDDLMARLAALRGKK